MRTIILASTSPRRKELMEIFHIPFIIEPPDYEEDMSIVLPPTDLAKFLSLGKAKSIAHKYKNAIIIAADSFIVVKNTLLGKPKNGEDAKRMLRMLSGTTHTIITGLAIIDTATNKVFSEVRETSISFKELSDGEIIKYIETKEPMDKAGAYALQELGAIFIEKMEGDFYSAVGLPIKRVSEILQKCGVSVL